MNGNSEDCFNESVLRILLGENSLLDTFLTKILICRKETETTVSLEFKMRERSNYEFIVLEFLGVEEYGFYSSKNYGNHIERYKLFLNQNGSYYISLDPFSESLIENDQDQDFVVSKSLILKVFKGVKA